MSSPTSLKEFAYPKKETVDPRFYEHPIAVKYQKSDQYLDDIFYRYRVYEQGGEDYMSPFLKMAKYSHLTEIWMIRVEMLMKIAQSLHTLQKQTHYSVQHNLLKYCHFAVCPSPQKSLSAQETIVSYSLFLRYLKLSERTSF